MSQEGMQTQFIAYPESTGIGQQLKIILNGSDL